MTAILVVIAVIYNAVLAALNAEGIAQSFATVAASEACILAAVCSIILKRYVRSIRAGPALLAVMTLIITVHISVLRGSLYVDCARNFLIICIFYTVGTFASQKEVLICFRVISLLVFSSLIIELVDIDLYVKLFQPAMYYASTRGMEQTSIETGGLFQNALGFEDRFSFGLSSHRTSALFLEQVSLANYAGVLCIFLLAMAGSTPAWDTYGHISLIILILLTNDSRTLTFLAICYLVGAIAFRYFSRVACIAIMPAAILLGLTSFMNSDGSIGDNLSGRINTTFQHLSAVRLDLLIGLSADRLYEYADSGYAYVLASSTILGLFAIWIFSSLSGNWSEVAVRRTSVALNLYLFTNLMIGGTGVFSLKVAAPLWLVVGFVQSQPPETNDEGDLEALGNADTSEAL